MAVVEGNWHDNTRSNPGRDWSHFTQAKYSMKGMNEIILPTAMDKKLGWVGSLVLVRQAL